MKRPDLKEVLQELVASGLSERAFSRESGIPRGTLRWWLSKPSVEPLPTHCPRCGEQYWVEVAALTGVQWEECRCGAKPVPLRRGP